MRRNRARGLQPWAWTIGALSLLGLAACTSQLDDIKLRRWSAQADAGTEGSSPPALSAVPAESSPAVSTAAAATGVTAATASGHTTPSFSATAIATASATASAVSSNQGEVPTPSDGCGGDCVDSCSACDAGGPSVELPAACETDRDCPGGTCETDESGAAVCVVPACGDGAQNGSETGVDCGGSCEPCGAGEACLDVSDCVSGVCSSVCQPSGFGLRCEVDEDCLSGACTLSACAVGHAGASCRTAADCASGNCGADGKCGVAPFGAACLQAADCASARCEAGTCQVSRFTLASDAGTDTMIVNHRLQVSANPEDPARAWRDVAFLYFFTPEVHDKLLSRCYVGPDFAVKDERFLAVSRDGVEWAIVWRALDSNNVPVPTTATSIELQVRNDPWGAFTLTNDHSYRTGGFAHNPKIVLCQRVDGRWLHTQGIAPSAFTDPCGLVVDTCAATDASCEVLVREQ